MAGLRVNAGNTVSVALVAATAKSAIMISAPTNQRIRINRIGIFFDGVSTTGIPITVRLMTATTAGTSTALTLVKIISSYSETIQTIAGENFTVEPTKTAVLDQWLIHPQAGLDWVYPWGQERMIVGGARVVVELTAAAVVNCRVKIDFEE